MAGDFKQLCEHVISLSASKEFITAKKEWILKGIGAEVDKMA